MRTPTRLAASILLVLAVLWGLPAQARVPEPDHIFFGVARRSGAPITTGTVTVVTGASVSPVASFTLDGVTSNFVLRVPIDSLAPQDPGTARPGDTARIYVNGQLAATTTVGERGTATPIDVDESGATTTALSSSSNPAPLGIGITLTATVAPAVTGAGQPTGNVTFRDGTTTLATVPVDANSRATHIVAGLTLGSHELVAEYAGAGIFGASRSDALQQVVLSQTATFLTRSVTTLRTGQPLTLTADVRSLSAGGGTPLGTVVFRDGAASLGAVPLSGAGQATLTVPSLDKGTHRLTAEYSGSPTFFPSRGGPITQGVTDAEVCSVASFAGSSVFPAGADPRSLVAGDWNRDGLMDLAVANAASNDVTLLLGDGLGGFVPAGPATPAGLAPQAVVMGDFNGDDNPDLAVAARDSNEVKILLGDGAGSLAAGGVTSVSAPRALVAVDVNLDGRMDLAAANQSANTVTLLIGDGAGAFTAQTPVAVGTLPTALAAGDVNGDGRPDLAVVNATSSDVTVLLGDGLGGLSSVATIAVAAFPQSVAIADLNADGNPDLVTVQSGSWDVHVLAGDGSGGFTEAAGSPFAAGSQPRGVSVADFDLDGTPDLAVVNAVSGDVTILAGDGAFGFSLAATRALGTAPFAVVVADFNNDGRPDLAAANSGSDNVSIQLSNCTASTTTTLASSVTPSAFGQAVTFTATVAPNPPGAGLPTGNVSFSLGGNSLGAGSINASGEALLTTDTLPPGTHSIEAVYEGDAGFSGSSSLPLTQVVTRVGTTTSLAGSSPSTNFGEPFTLTATVIPLAPGLPGATGDVVFRDGGNVIGTAPVSGGVAIFVTSSLATGTRSLTADYVGDVNHAPSASAVLSHDVILVATVSIADASVSEGYLSGSTMSFVVGLSTALGSPVSVQYATADGTAISGTDYVATTGTLTFAPGELLKSVTVAVLGDTVVEPNESFTLNLSTPSGASILDGTGAGTILNDDGPTLSVTNSAVVEGTTGTPSNLAFNVVLSATSTQTITVDYATSDGTATAGGDYTAKTGTLTFTPGMASQVVQVAVIQDSAIEPDETMLLNLSNPTNATIFDGLGQGTIQSDDGLRLSIADKTTVEGNAGFTPVSFTVSLSAAPTGPVTVDYATADGTATAPADYTAAAGTVTFAAGEQTKTVTVQVVGEATQEAYETFLINLSNPTGGANIADGQAQGTITNTDGSTDRSRLMFHNFVTNRLYRWHIKNGNTLDTFNWVTPFATDPGWTVGAVADFDQDGQLDYLWHNVNDGRLLFWYIDGDNLKGFQFLPYAVAPGWRVATAFDANGDGAADIAYYDTRTPAQSATSGQVMVFMHDNAVVLGSHVLDQSLPVGGTRRVVNSVDANADGDDELVLYDSATGQVTAWDVARAVVGATITYPNLQSTSNAFNLVSTRTDFNNDGFADLLWHNPTPTGVLSVWFMNGTTRIGIGQFLPFTATDPVWTVVGSANVW